MEVSRRRFSVVAASPLAGGFDFAPAFVREDMAYRHAGVVATEMRVGLWVIVLGYVAMWLGAVVWWQRRRARVMCDLTESVMGKEVVR